MGIVLSPDNKTIWFAEIIGNKIGSFDIESKSMTEFPTGDITGPTLLTFDDKGVLWVTLSYSNSILKVEPWLLIPESRASGMSEIKLDNPDIFSPFGIAITQDKHNVSTIFPFRSWIKQSDCFKPIFRIEKLYIILDFTISSISCITSKSNYFR